MAKVIQSACSFLEANQNRRFTMAIWPIFLGRLEALRASSWPRLAQLGGERAALGL